VIWLRAVWAWLRRRWKVAAGVVGGALVVGVGAFLAVGAYRRRVSGLRDALDVERARRDVAELRARREELMTADAADERAVAEIDVRLDENRDRIAAARRRADVPDDELEAEFARLGF